MPQTPVPLSPTCTVFAFVALLVMFSCPVAGPVPVGANVIVKVNELLGLMLAGSSLWLVAWNDEPLTVICDTRTGADPSFVTVMIVLALWPI